MKVICPNCKSLVGFVPADTQIETCRVCGEYFIIDVEPIGYTSRITSRALPEITMEETDAAEKRYYLNRLEAAHNTNNQLCNTVSGRPKK